MGGGAVPVAPSGTAYWIVAESHEPAFVDPVWVAAGNGPLYTMGNIDFASSPNWQVGQTGGPPGAVVSATPVPEPGALALGLLGLPLVPRLTRRRR